VPALNRYQRCNSMHNANSRQRNCEHYVMQSDIRVVELVVDVNFARSVARRGWPTVDCVRGEKMARHAIACTHSTKALSSRPFQCSAI
jgi:hypothetical protein